MSRTSRDLAGQRFGKLTIIEKVDDPSTRYQVWSARCDCGETILVTSNTVRTLTHCGCKSWGNGRAVPGELGYKGGHGSKLGRGGASIDSVIASRFSIYKRSAKQRGYSWELTLDQFIEITYRLCHYCGSPPSQVHHLGNGAQYTYNGIDRINNSIGYTNNNVVPCCGVCNIAKHTMSYDEFVQWICRVANHLKCHK